MKKNFSLVAEIARAINPAIIWLFAILLYLFIADTTIAYVSTHIDTGNGLATFVIYIFIIIGFALMIVKVFSRLYAAAKKAYMRQTKMTRPFVAALVAPLAIFLAFIFIIDFDKVFDNYIEDAERIVGSFVRIEQAPTMEKADDLVQNYTGPMAGRNFGGLYASISGIYGIVPDTAIVNFKAQLRKLWAKKMKDSRNAVVDRVYNGRVMHYSPEVATKMTLEDYLTEVDQVIEETRENLDWPKLASLEGLMRSELSLVKSIAESITAKDLVSYGLTELMPGVYEGNLNKNILDFLLRNAGREYIEFIPALSDPYTSFGLWQFTSYAVYDVGSEKRGASLVNRALPQAMRIPGSVMQLNGNDHAKAAYLFSIHNLALLVKDLNVKQIKVLSDNWRRHQDDIVKYIATSHNNPRDARHAAKCWLNNSARSDYTKSCRPTIVMYSKKTHYNRLAIYGRQDK